MADAIVELETAVDLKPKDAELQFYLGRLYLLAKDRGRANDQYAKLKSLDAILAQKLYEFMAGGRTITVSDFR
jgi:protein involved in temperature-dependent protein secretion